MPYMHITTSKKLTPEEKTDLQNCALKAADLLGKPRQHVMVNLQDGAFLTKGGVAGSCAFCDVRVFGAPPREACDAFSTALNADITRIAQTDPGCVYISISALTSCYTDGCAPPNHS